MELLDKYNAARDEVFAYFGYKEDWRILPLDDAREMYWRLDEQGTSTVTYAKSEEELESGEGECYESSIYYQRHLPRWVYRAAEYTMVVTDTHCDGNQLLQVFTNSFERP